MIARMLKKVFPRPVIPQKRYIILIIIIFYWVMKAYTLSTPSTADDEIPDDIVNSASLIYADDTALDYDPFTDEEKQ